MIKIFIRDEDGCNAAVDTRDAVRQQQLAGVFGRSEEIGLLTQAWTSSQSHLLLLNGATGVGKTALLQKWLHSMQSKQWLDADAVYCWSFYPPDLAHSIQDPVEEFFHHALLWFGGEEAAACPNLLQGEMLARLSQSHHTLLILDGLEILQARSGSSIGKLGDPRMLTLLERLAEHNPGLCVAVSREPLEGGFATKAGVQRYGLENLPEEDCIGLLRYKGVQGEDDRLRQMAVDYGQNPLTLTLLGGYLAVWHGGDWRRMDRIPVLMDQQQDGRQARRILVANATELAGKPGESLLYLLSMLYRPTHWSRLENLLGAKRGWPLLRLFQKKNQDNYSSLVASFGRLGQKKRYEATLQLRELGLLSLTGRCFWLPQWVREAYQRQFRYDWPTAWKEANQRLMLFHATLPKEPEALDITPLSAMQPRIPFSTVPLDAVTPPETAPVDVAMVEAALRVMATEPVAETTPLMAEPQEAEAPAIVVAQEAEIVPGETDAVEAEAVPEADVVSVEEAVDAIVVETLPTVSGQPALDLPEMETEALAPATIAEEPQAIAPEPQAVAANIVPFVPRVTITSADLQEIGQLADQLQQFHNSLQMLQIRTKKFQKCIRQLDKEVQSMHYQHTRTRTGS
ncbi:AAA family ATPase [Candidatus Thiothrix sp. Deng01]|uniref:AAA family ATPase n=1 Tax=Candidatus Thiothrix phosphatis TaxID=3112415 RepID=A0ABU6D358_9GAMM|nr:AAA family ATPase [Candidatus Thiothrix sp. Deng01]MEB4593536.1 AAA family ATPase [Candidatus Thiothrix sp. Deng01]